LEFDDDNFKILKKQNITKQHFLKLNVDKLMQDGLKQESAKEITEFIDKIKDEEQN
ncbi:20879_t:CDS:1, partial [Cetraspora pellucida]